MKRKVIQLAGNTLVVSLPKAWAIKHSVKKGDEITINEKGSIIEIHSNGGYMHSEQEVDLRGSTPRTALYMLAGLHHIGVDEFHIRYNDEKVLELIQNLLQEGFIGFMIVKQEPECVTIRSIAPNNPMEFNATLRRAFLVAISLAKSSAQLIQGKKFNQLNKLLQLEKVNNQLTFFCERVVVKHGLQGKKDFFVYMIPSYLNKIADRYRDICVALEKEKSTAISNEVMRFYDDVNNLLYLYYEVYYQFNIEKVNEIGNIRNELISRSNDLIKVAEPLERIIIMNLYEIVRRICNSMSSTVILNL